MSQYRTIQGVRYERDLLEAAHRFTQGKGESRISYQEIQELYRMAEDGRRITDTERRTLIFIANRYKFTDKARQWLESKMGLSAPRNDIDSSITRIIREEYGLKYLKWKIGAEEVARQEALGQVVLFGPALRSTLDAFIHWSMGPLSLAGVVSRRDLLYQENSTPDALIRKYIDRGLLFIFPLDETERREQYGEQAAVLNVMNNWVFGLLLPDFHHLLFIANVLRRGGARHSYATFFQQGDFEHFIQAVIQQYAGMMRLKWSIDQEEVSRQMQLLPGQNFGNALFAALNFGVFNGESSMSFRDFIRMEIWKDPDLELDHYIRRYLDFATLYLIPIDHQEQAASGTFHFPLPDRFSPWMEGEWYFGLEMPKKTQVRFIINAPREYQDGQTAWIDGFVLHSLSFDEQLRQVLDEDFKLSGLQVIFPQQEFDAQRLQYGPDWRYASGLFRQALHTALDDYLTPQSLFQITALTHAEDIDPEDVDDPQEYRAAIRHRIREYLVSATLSLHSASAEETPANGEELDDNWLFYLHVPALSDHGYWIVIPRWPDDEQKPYIYGVN